jgi:hypothetical protein
MVSFVLKKDRKENYFLLKIKCTEEEQVLSVEAGDNSTVMFFPGDFPESVYFVRIITEKTGIEELNLFIALKDERKFALSLMIKNDKIYFKDFLSEDIKTALISDNELKARERLAVELFLSDEGLMSELMDVSDNPEQDMSYGELECEQVARRTVYLNEEDAVNYINYNVVKSPQSVWNKILGKY